MGNRRTETIATVYGNEAEKATLNQLAAYYNMSVTRLLKNLINGCYRDTFKDSS